MTQQPTQNNVLSALQADDLLAPLTITDVTIEGQGVARYQGRVIFLEQGLPGDVVAARVKKITKNIVYANIETLLQPSPHTVTPWCPHAEECGGCLWQHFSPSAACAWKEKHVRETLTRIGKIPDIPVSAIISSPQSRQFRNKMSYAFFPGEGGSTLLGLRRRKEKSVIEITACGLQPPVAMQLLECVRQSVNLQNLAAWDPPSVRDSDKQAEPGRGYLRFLVIHTPEYAPKGQRQLLVECITGTAHEAHCSPGLKNKDAVYRLGQELMERFDLTGFVHSERKSKSDIAQGERTVTVLGADEYQESFGELLLSVPHNAFLQTNTRTATALYESIAEEAGLDGTQVLWDVYSGVGGIALFLAGKAQEVQAFEIQKEASAAAMRNSARLGYEHCHFHASALTQKLARTLPPPDVIIMDPPRAGISPEVVDILCGIPAKKLLSVSCDVATQARDIARLNSVWLPAKAIPVDMFPYTPHLENLIVLRRR